MLPTPDSLAERLYGLDRAGFRSAFGEPSADRPGPSPSLHQGLLGDRLAGTAWYAVGPPDVLAAARFSPVSGRPAGLGVLFTVPSGEPLAPKLEEVGFPAPEAAPTFVIGGGEVGGSVAYMPGPEGLAELIYQIDPSEDRLCVAVWSERPAEPRHSRLVEGYRRRFDWEGTMRFPDLWAFGARKGELLPPGDVRARLPDAALRSTL